MKDYRITVKVRNNRLLKAIEAIGGETGQKWCDENGLSYNRVNKLINMKCSPLTALGELYPDAERLCEILDKIPSDLWSNEQLYPLERNFSEMEMDYSQVLALLPNSEQSYLPDFSEIEEKQTKKLLSNALSTLTSREQEVIRLRFEDDLTLDEIGRRLGVTNTWIRQIEVKALRKLRHSDNSIKLVDCIDVGEKMRNRIVGNKTA